MKLHKLINEYKKLKTIYTVTITARLFACLFILGSVGSMETDTISISKCIMKVILGFAIIAFTVALDKRIKDREQKTIYKINKIKNIYVFNKAM